METYTFTQWVFFFYLYSFLGWIWESAYVSIKDRHLVNRGFLKGPFLPIYGFGALCVLFVTIPFRGNVFLMALSGMVSASVLEYVTGAVMEKLFRVRYWDYSHMPLNLNGYICLASALCWGVMTLLVVDVFQVYLDKLVQLVTEQTVTVIVFIATPFLTADLVTSFSTAIHLRDLMLQLERVQEEIDRLTARRQELETAIRVRREELEYSFNERRLELEAVVKAAGEKANGKLPGLSDKTLSMQDITEKIPSLQDFSEKLASFQELPGKAASIQELTGKLAAIQEKVSALAAESNLMLRTGEKAIRGLLKRNPKAVSFTNKEAFESLKHSHKAVQKADAADTGREAESVNTARESDSANTVREAETADTGWKAETVDTVREAETVGEAQEDAVGKVRKPEAADQKQKPGAE